MFEKLVAVEPLNTDDAGRARLAAYARQAVFYEDRPADTQALVSRMQGADAVLVSYTTPIPAAALRASAGTLRYVGMCCSLYSPESANVDIRAANELGIVVKGVKDYGDEGVPEYVISELVRFLHGFGGRMWRDFPTELTGVPVGVLGMGTTGRLVARALRFFGADVSYYSRTRKPEIEAAEGIKWREMDALLDSVDIVVTCLNRNVILLGEAELARFSGNKILVNISIGPGHDTAALGPWLDAGNTALADSADGIDPAGRLMAHPNVILGGQTAGRSVQALGRLARKAAENIEDFFAGK